MFCAGLRDERLVFNVGEKGPTTLDEAATYALQLSEFYRQIDVRSKDNHQYAPSDDRCMKSSDQGFNIRDYNPQDYNWRDTGFPRDRAHPFNRPFRGY